MKGLRRQVCTSYVLRFTLYVLRFTLYVFTFYVFISPLLANDETKPASISPGNWSAATTADNGVRVAYRGVTVVNGTRFVLTDLSRRHVLFSSAASRPAVQVHAASPNPSLRLTFEGRGQLADGSEWTCAVSQHILLLAGNRVRITGDVSYAGATPALLSSSGVWLAANPLKGCVWRGRGANDELVHGQLPLQPNITQSGTRDFRFTLIRAFVRSRIGDLLLTVGGNCGALNFTDARREKMDDPQHAAVFFLGVNNVRLQPGESKRWEVTLNLTDNPARLVRPTSPAPLPGKERMGEVNRSMGQWVNDRLSVVEVSDAQTPVEEKVVIVPRPQVYEPRSADFLLRASTRILFAESNSNAEYNGSSPHSPAPSPKASGEGERGADSRGAGGEGSPEERAARYLAKELRRRFNLNLSVSRLESEALPENVIFVGRYGSGACGMIDPVRRESPDPAASVMVENPNTTDTPVESLPAEGYVLSADDRRVVVTGADARGIYYGVQTLLQMVKMLSSGQRAVQGAQVRDYPDFPFRGIHLHADEHTLPWVTQLIERVLSRLKINYLVLECQYARWDSHSELAPPWAMPKEDMRQLRRVAEEHFIQVIPLIQSLGHAEWMFARGKNLDLAEDRNVPYACCPSEPRVYNLLFDVYREAIELFQPEYLHIGHDEIANRGRFGECPRCFGTPIPELFWRHVMRLHAFLRGRGVKTMMWGDMLLAPGEARDAVHGGPPMNVAPVREWLPRDLVICDWHYEPAYDYPSVRVFRRLGFPVIGSTWHNPYNIYAFSRSAYQAGAMGMLQTTWAGYHGNRTVLRREPRQVAAYVLAAERAWNARGSYTLPYVPRYWLREQITDTRPPSTGVRKGFCLDLSPLGNIDLVDNDQLGGWLRMEAGNDLRRVPTGRRRLGGTLFQIAASDRYLGGRGIMLRGNYTSGATFPESVAMSVRRRVRELHFLHTCAWQVAPGTKVGAYEILFTDGSREEVELLYGDNIAAWDDPAAWFAPYALWHGYTLQGVPVTLQAAAWESSSGGKEIDKIVFRSTHPEASPVLLAVTGVEE